MEKQKPGPKPPDEPYRAMSLRLPKSLFDRAEQAARGEGQTLTAWIKQAVIDKLEKPGVDQSGGGC